MLGKVRLLYLCLASSHHFEFVSEGGGAYKVLDYRITVDFFKNYRNIVIKFLYNYRHRSIFY